MRSLEWFARDRIEQFRRQTTSVEASDSLFDSAKAALKAIKLALKSLETLLDDATADRNGGPVSDDDEALQQACITVNQKLSALTTYLGIILRSSNTRNSFEYYYALNHIATHFTADDQRLILSSEWEYSPFYIPQPPDALRDYVFIGFPAYLSRNSLLMPLAAHELAHAIWHIRSLEGPVFTTLSLGAEAYIQEHHEEIKTDLASGGDLFFDTQLEEFRSEVLDAATRQAEEVFCDLFGVALFRESYVYAFNSFVLPGTGARVGDYPRLAARVHYIGQMAADLKLGLKQQPKLPLGPTPKGRSVRNVADQVVENAVPALMTQAKSIADEVAFGQGESAEDIKVNFRNRVPALMPRSPVEVLNATWSVYLEWLDKTNSDGERHERFRVVNNLCLKSLETYEIAMRKPFK